MKKGSTLLLASLLIGGCASPGPQESKSIEGAQQVFFPDRYHYSVGDFVLSLPIGYYETTMNRLAFAEKILTTGSPKSVLEQETYLVLEEDALAPKRHFLLLDQRHLLIYSEPLQREGGYPGGMEVLRRISDAGWKNVSDSTIPAWARHPKSAQFSPNTEGVTITKQSGETTTLRWRDGKLAPG
jgi:hypothetical protein